MGTLQNQISNFAFTCLFTCFPNYLFVQCLFPKLLLHQTPSILHLECCEAKMSSNTTRKHFGFEFACENSMHPNECAIWVNHTEHVETAYKNMYKSHNCTVTVLYINSLYFVLHGGHLDILYNTLYVTWKSDTNQVRHTSLCILQQSLFHLSPGCMPVAPVCVHVCISGPCV